MKNHLIILLVAVFTFSCETAPKEVELGPAPGYLPREMAKFMQAIVLQLILGFWKNKFYEQNKENMKLMHE